MALASQKLAGSRSGVKQAFASPVVKSCMPRLPVLKTQRSRAVGKLVVRASAEESGAKETKSGGSAVKAPETNNWVPVCKPEDLPKGVRKEVMVDETSVLLFWYRNQIYCIEARSPAEGAYSEGFIKAKFTQDFCIECPSTGSLFSLQDGSIKSWYPNNPVLKALTPQNLCRDLEIYPVKLQQDAIYVDVSNTAVKAVGSRGGADTSVESNNVFSVQPTVYFDGMDPTKESASLYLNTDGPQQALNPVVGIVGAVAVGIVGAIGTGVALYLENIYLLAAFWLVLGTGVLVVGFNYLNKQTLKT